MNFWFQSTIFLLLGNLLQSQNVHHRIVYQWVTFDYEYPSEEARNEAIIRGDYIPMNVLINDVDYYAPTNRYFVASPLFREGIPASLSEIIPNHRGQGILRPFPSWPTKNQFNKPDCFNPLSVFRIWIDKCGLLWVIDSGRSNILSPDNTFDCPPKLSVYNLNRGDQLILRYEFPSDVTTDSSYIVAIVTESNRSDCSDSIAYISDCNANRLIVFDYATLTSYSIDNKLFYPFPQHFDVYSNGVVFRITDGILGLALGPRTDPDRKLYFHSFASVHESWVPLNVLKNQTVAQNQAIGRTAYVLSPGQREGQSMSQVMTDDGILIYSLIPQNSIACWNSRTPFTPENQHILERNDEDFQYASGLKLKNNKLHISSSRFQNYLLGLANNTDIKYRVMVVDDVKEWLRNSPCNSVSFGSTGGDYFNHGFTQSTAHGDIQNRFSSRTNNDGAFSWARSYGKSFGDFFNKVVHGEQSSIEYPSSNLPLSNPSWHL